MEALTEASKTLEGTLEAVRLLIWDLDETFWKGTLTEGGITEFIVDHHKMVIELARRGIMSSICSKNDYTKVQLILTEQGLWDYFIFPSIDWSPKGPRLAQIIEKAQLRAPTIMFIDDNPGNRAEATAMIPGLQVKDEKHIFDLLNDPAFEGKDDSALSRLKQYKLLEARQADAAKVGDNLEFLRSSGIKVIFDYDIEENIDRVIELVNRTNQLNFTKKRLPEDRESAAETIRNTSRSFWQQLGLVRVFDSYGDYGHVGFFQRDSARGSGPGRLEHFCFSCRVLGMGVEKWVYDKLGSPTITVVGDVVTNLFGGTDVDWITLASGFEEQAEGQKSIPEVRLRGGCEVDTLYHYFAIHSDNCWREGTLIRGPFFVRKDVTAHLVLSPEIKHNPDWLNAVRACGLESTDFESAVFEPCQPGTVVIYSGLGDLYHKVQHRQTGQLFNPPYARGINGCLETCREQFDEIAAREGYSADEKAAVWSSIVGRLELCNATFPGGPFGFDQLEADLSDLFARFPSGCIGFALGADEFAGGERGKWYRPLAKRYNEMLRRAASPFGIEVFSFGDFVASDTERDEDGHFHRIVYFRLAQAILQSVEHKGSEMLSNSSKLWDEAYARAIGPYHAWDEIEKRVPGRPDFLCIGAQKASTTWLHSNLQYHPLIWLPPIKEVGFFNAVHLRSTLASALSHRRRQVKEARAWWLTADEAEDKRNKALQILDALDSDRIDDAWYSQVFSFHGQDQVCGEITPEYCCLPREGVRHVLSFNAGIKVIVMVRDPAERALSHAKMLLGSKADRQALEELVQTDDFLALWKYSDYAAWVGRWRGMLPSGNLHVEGVRDVKVDPLGVLGRICQFLGLPFHPGFFSAAHRPIFESERIEGEDEIRAIIRARMDPLYEDLEKFPEILAALARRG